MTKHGTIHVSEVPSYQKAHYPTQKHWDYYQSLPKGKKHLYYKKYPEILAKASKQTDDFIAQQKKELGLESVNEARLDPKQLLQQLGGNRFIAMTGAKNLAFDKAKNTLHMKIGRNAKGVNHLRIKLTGADLYLSLIHI